MNAKQVQALRSQINAAHAAGDLSKADKLQAKLHAHFVAESDKFINSKAGQTWMNGYLMNRG